VSKAKIVLACLIWLVLLGAGVTIYKLWLVPSKEKRAKEEQKELLEQTSGSSSYKYTINVGMDAFSGYAILRSSAMRKTLRERGIKINVVDDAADYDGRLSALASGDLDFAAFPIDALLKSSSNLGKLPATIIAIIDETQGADAVVAYKDKFPSIQALDAPDTRFVFVGNSPSETLARMVLHTFDLTHLTEQSFDPVDSEDQLMKRYRAAKPGGTEVFVTWEPVVSQLVGDGELMHKLYDTFKQPGLIVDALVVSRDYLVKNEAVVQDVLAGYLKARHEYASPKKLQELVLQDAEEQGAPLDANQAEALVKGIVWKNTQDNLAHFGLRSSALTHIEDTIDLIKQLLLDTGGLSSDPTGGNSNKLFYDRTMVNLQTSGFHPGARDEAINEVGELPQLSDAEWSRLQPIGKVAVPPLIYARGTARLTESSKVKLDSLIETLSTFPRAYLEIRGDASSRGDEEANRRLAKQRADAALQYLLDRSVPASKMRAVDGEITGKTSVTFVLAEVPY
jgi:outer membrane protein OmpA-like peptidoglycan-associated protein